MDRSRTNDHVIRNVAIGVCLGIVGAFLLIVWLITQISFSAKITAY